MVLEGYKDLVGAAAGIATIGQQFAPAFICLKVTRQGNTKNVDKMPFIGGLVMCLLFGQYGLLLNDATMINVNVFGLVLNLIYFLIYYKYTEDKADLMQALGKGVILVSVLVGYVQFESSHERAEFYFGLTITLLMFALLAAPLLGLKEIIETKNTAKLPFPLILSGTVVTALWLLYGIIIKNVFVQVQNVIALLLCSAQLSLFAIYPSRPIDNDKQD